MKNIWGTSLLVALLCGAAHSQVLFQTGFDAPAYVPGVLGTQDGWTAGASATVQGTTVFSGTQALQFDASGVTGSQHASHAVKYSSVGKSATIVRASANFFVSIGGTMTAWDILAASSASSFLCHLYVSGGPVLRLGLQSSSVGSIPLVRGVWHQAQIDFDFVTKTCAAHVDGVLVGSGPFPDVSDFATVQIGINAAPGTDKAYWDDIVVAAVDRSIQVVEFYNSVLDHFFVTANSIEAAAIDSGSAGPGWSRSGNSFALGGNVPVCRFYGSQLPGPNSHFYTADSSECAALKSLQASTPQTQKRWNFESNDFITTAPVNRICGAGLTPVYRAYNGGFARGIDGNHRITSSLWAIQSVVRRGWLNEGVVMCAP